MHLLLELISYICTNITKYFSCFSENDSNSYQNGSARASLITPRRVSFKMDLLVIKLFCSVYGGQECSMH